MKETRWAVIQNNKIRKNEVGFCYIFNSKTLAEWYKPNEYCKVVKVKISWED